MRGEVFKNTLRLRWREGVYWSAGLVIFALYVVILVPDSEGLEGYISLMEAMPPALMKGLGVSDLSVISTPEGFFGFAFFTYAVILLSVFGIQMGLNITANDEELGAMNALLALPLPRWRVVVERAAAYTLVTCIATLGAWFGLVIGKSINPAVATVDLFRMLQACLGMVPIVLTIMGVTALLGVVIRRRNVAGALAGTFVAGSYILNSIGAAAGADLGNLLQRLSVYSYFNGTSAALNGLDVGPFIAFILIAVVLLAGTVRMFEHRDIAV